MKTCIYFLFLSFFTSFSQLDQYQIYAGYVGFGKNAHFNARGINENAFSNFSGVPIIGAGFSMFVSNHLRLGANLEGTPQATKKDRYTMSFVSLNPTLDFHILPFYKRISPFISLNGNCSFLNFSQEAFKDTLYPIRVYSQQTASNLLIVSEEIDLPYFKLQSQPLFGGGIGAGVDVKIKKHWGIILAATFNRLFQNSNPVIKENLKNNTYNLSYSTLTFKLRYRIF